MNDPNATDPSQILAMTFGRTMPFLQDTKVDPLWQSWTAKYRDVIILDSSNRVEAVFNLTVNDLSVSTNRTRLKELFRAVANGGDSDVDRLPDHWEY